MRCLIISAFSVLTGFTSLFAQSLADTVHLVWATEASPLVVSSRDGATAVATEADGNLYIAGKSQAPRTGYDFLILKYDNSGSLMWSARYDGPEHGNDVPLAMEVDTDGNVYATGISTGTGSTGLDIATAKYNSAGTLVWAQRYSPTPSCLWGYCWFATDAGVDLFVDQTGNVFVAGYVTEDWDGVDMLTIKYGANGNEEWVRTHDGPFNGLDRATSVVADESGGVYVTGVSADSTYYDQDGFADCISLRYDPSGNLIWEHSLSAGNGKSTDPVGTALHADGSLYIAGNVSGSYRFGTGYEGDTDIFTAKYSPAGSLEWMNLFSTTFLSDAFPPTMYDVATSMALDGEGNVFVAGHTGRNDPETGAGDSLLVIKYRHDGTLQWSGYHGNGYPESVRPAGIVTDVSGSVYIAATSGLADGVTFTGNTEVLLKYGPSGEIEWAEHHGAADDTVRLVTGIAADLSGNLFVVGGSGIGEESDFTALKYSASGSHLATFTAGGPGAITGFAHDARVDDQGYVYLVGTTVGTGMNQDYMTVKVNPSGEVVWAATYDGPDHSTDNAQAIELDQWGNVYVTGLSLDSEGRSASATIRYTASGRQVWVSSLDSSSMRVIRIDSDGNVYAGGNGFAKFAQDGAVLWHDAASRVTDLAFGDSNVVYVAGDGLRKLNVSGGEIWNISMAARGVAVDGSQNVYVSAPSWYGDYTKKFTSAGVELWTAAGGGDKIVLLDSNTVYVGGGYYARVRRLTADGDVLWSNTISADRRRDFDVDPEGNVYYAGTSLDGTGLHAAKFSAGGETEWTLQKEETFHAMAIRADNAGNVFLISEKEEMDFSRTPLIEKYVQEPTVTVSEGIEAGPVKFKLEQNYPNPFNPSTAIRFSIPAPADVSLKVFNLLGEEVATLLAGHRNGGSHSVVWDAAVHPSGVYFYRLRAGSLVETRKLMLIR